MKPRRIALVGFLIIVVALLLAPTALAAAGGGSGGFGGGGGGGGRGAGLYILFQILIRIALFGHGLGALILIGLIVMAVLFANVAPRVQRFWSAQQDEGRTHRRPTAKRKRRVELAAAEAAEDDPAFAPQRVREEAAELFAEVQAAWDRSDRQRLRDLVAPGLLAEWERRLDDFERRGWTNRVQLLAAPTVEYVGLEHRGQAGSDRVTVRIQARLRDYVEDQYGNHVKRLGRIGESVTVREFWTLARRDGKWIVLSLEHGAEGAHALEEQIVASPWSDEQALRDEARVEQAVADALPEHVRPGEVANLHFERDARAAALDLSLADDRFAPDILEVAARRAVTAWAEAVDGADHALRALADKDAVENLLHPGDPAHRTRLVVRGPAVKQIRITGLDPVAEPPTMTIEVDLDGRRYIEDRDTAAVLSGSRSRRTTFTETWTLALSGDSAQPWRIQAVAAPVGRA
jgi:predicted lipid-binding transport protein (Tim44 family)